MERFIYKTKYNISVGWKATENVLIRKYLMEKARRAFSVKLAQAFSLFKKVQLGVLNFHIARHFPSDQTFNLFDLINYYLSLISKVFVSLCN